MIKDLIDPQNNNDLNYGLRVSHDCEDCLISVHLLGETTEHDTIFVFYSHVGITGFHTGNMVALCFMFVLLLAGVYFAN